MLGILEPRHLGMGAWLTPRNSLLPHMCYHTKCRRSRSNHMGVSRGSPKFLGDAGPPLPWNGGMANPQKTCSCPMCVTTSNFRRSRSNHSGVCRGSQKLWGDGPRPLGGGAVTPRNMFLPTCLTMSISVILGQTVRT